MAVGAVAGAAPTDAFVEAVAADLKAHRGSSLVVAGESQPPAVHALAHAINEALGNVGKTVTYSDPVAAGPANQAASLAELVADMNAGKVSTLVILEGNPVFTAPADLEFARAMEQGRSAHPPRPLRRRDVAPLPLARARRRIRSRPGATRAPSTER